ncbi:MAG: hypothetical protein M1818_000398 [Claussenomyces sp. TS43310]|nr:MAG: hypothetical protein M1818_000398 [Claussenomyces sp. TS43310]
MHSSLLSKILSSARRKKEDVVHDAPPVSRLRLNLLHKVKRKVKKIVIGNLDSTPQGPFYCGPLTGNLPNANPPETNLTTIGPPETTLTTTNPQETNLRTTTSPPTNAPATPPPLFSLPHEIICEIANILPPSSAAALTFCNRSLLEILGTQYWQRCSLKRFRGEKLALLALLCKDSIDEINCHRCVRLHKTGHGSTLRACYYDDMRRGAWNVFREGFQFIDMQMAMKLYNLGRDPSPILRRMAATRQWLPSKKFLYDSLEVHEPRIRAYSFGPAQFLWRSQYWLLWPPRRPLRRRRFERLVNCEPERKIVCCHMSLLKSWHLLEDFACEMRGKDGLRHSYTDQCGYCATDFQVDVKDLGRGRKAFVLTRWMNLGSGSSPFDRAYWSHFKNDERRARRDEQNPMPLAMGYIKARFEDFQTYQPLLSRENEVLLLGIRDLKHDLHGLKAWYKPTWPPGLLNT